MCKERADPKPDESRLRTRSDAHGEAESSSECELAFLLLLSLWRRHRPSMHGAKVWLCGRSYFSCEILSHGFPERESSREKGRGKKRASRFLHDEQKYVLPLLLPASICFCAFLHRDSDSFHSF